uniref:Uncharacterized protein n=1 Tax=Panagrolaimus sp. JU765 TaxID=591449 RepID=A0AC34QFN3_9BILA
MAGKFYHLNGEYKTAMEMLLSAKDDDKAMPLAIQCAVESKDNELIKQLTDYLLGESDGIPKDPNFIFRLYVEMHMYSEAAKTAIILSQEEQKRGNYKLARDLLFQMHRQLIIHNLRVPSNMIDALVLLHSYLIVKPLVKRNEQKNAARMLIRVADQISSFSTRKLFHPHDFYI